MKLIAVDRDDIELIAKIEAMGIWQEERYIADKHSSFDVWTWNGKTYKIYKDSKRMEN